MLDVTNIKNDSVLLYLGCILSAEKVDKIWERKCKHQIQAQNTPKNVCLGRILSVGKVDTWQVAVGGDRLCLTSWQEVWEGAEKLDGKNDMYLILIHFCISKPIMAHQLTRRVGGRWKIGRKKWHVPDSYSFFCISKPIMVHQLTRRVGGAEKLDKIDAYYLNLLILFNI